MKLVTRIRLAARVAALAPSLLVSPALADEATPCWTYGDTPGLFSWSKPPSMACRDGTFISGVLPNDSAEEPRHDHIAEDAPDAGKPASTTTFTFSGNAYIGVAARF